MEEIAHIPTSHYHYGCCHGCTEFKNCRDFIARHLHESDKLAAPATDVDSFNRDLLAEQADIRPPLPITLAADEYLRVAVVDDEAHLRTAVSEFLAALPFLHVVGIGDDVPILDRLREMQPHVILLDLIMRGTTGFQICRALRAAPNTATARIIVLTGFASEETIRDVRSAGADAILAKPADLDVLRHTIIAGVASSLRRREPKSQPMTPLGQAHHETHARKPVRVLVVDDQEWFATAVTEFLSASSLITVRTALSGAQAIKELHDFRPHVLVLDLILPDVDGFHICEQVRRAHSDSHIKILVLTGNSSHENLRRAIMCGADLCLHKPIALDILKYEVWRLGLLAQTANAQHPHHSS